MTLYSFRGAYPSDLPDRIRLSDGFTRTNSSGFTPEELSDAGFVEVAATPEVVYPNKLDWVNSNWSIRVPNESETMFKRNEIKNECVKLLRDTDYKVIKALETGVPLDSIYTQYRQALRDLYNNADTIVDIWSVSLPLVSDYTATV